MDAKRAVTALGALAQDTRLRAFRLLVERGPEGLPAGQLATALGVPPAEIERVHRPIGLDIGSRTPAEIAISTLAGLLADRNGRAGGFAHGR